MASTVATVTPANTAVKTQTRRATETPKIALVLVLSILLNQRLLPAECFDLVPASLLNDQRLSYEAFLTCSQNGQDKGQSEHDSSLPVLKSGRTPSSTKVFALLEAIFTTLQAPNDLYGIQFHVYEERTATREMVEAHNIRLESQKPHRVKDQHMTLFTFLCNFKAYSCRLPVYTGKISIKVYLIYKTRIAPNADLEGFESTLLSDLPDVHVSARDGFQVHEEKFPLLEFRTKKLKVQVEYLLPTGGTQETTQGSIRDPRTEVFLKAVLQDMDTPTGGDPTQQRPPQDWYNERHVQTNENVRINCACGSSAEDAGMMRCKNCNTKQHASCYGQHHYNSHGVLIDHVCWFCLFGKSLDDDEKRREVSDMARLRRAMAVFWTHGSVDEQTLAVRIDCSRANARRIVECLRDWQFVKGLPSNNTRDEMAFSVSTEGQKQNEFVKWFSGGNPDHRI